MRMLRRVLWWMGGAPADILDKCDPCLQRKHTARGIVFTLNFIFLVCVWADVGFHYFGWFGIACPGLIVPSILVLGLGRLIAMHRRRLTGQLAVYEMQPATSSRWFLAPRIALALVLSSATTLSLMMIESADLIGMSAAERAKSANSSLYYEKISEINATYNTLEGAAKSRVEDLMKERVVKSDSLAASMAAINDATVRHEQAVRETSFEKGGLDSRRSGPGIKFHAWRDLGDHYKDVIDQETERQHDAAQSIRQLNDTMDAERDRVGRLEADRQRALNGVAQSVRNDVGYVKETQGLFSDATLFLSLYGRSDVGPGMWGVSIVLAAFLFMLELADLIAVSLSPCEIVPMGEWTSVRLATAKLIAGAEIQLASSAASRPRVWIEAPSDTRPPHIDAATDPECITESPLA